ncbi:family 2 glycosyl transferase [Thermincola ferriacetica]|uniref:Glucosyl-3-phosphoglycerate synthase n=1 Tax=Thermincola ferriacetica TaxID=281456 RepID=A0A0L6W5T5_9FIRM|nr:glycosyltransferase family 2 protein [Thermincola ferriacetica]KNZ70748.1 family 2 glycosyl transferase [Thermincola ferriacetica]
MRKKVSVLIPAYNEAKYIFQTVAAVKKIPEVDEVFVIDDASTDNTSELAKKAGAEVLTLRENHGKGGALNKGIALATGDVIALIDGDVGETASEVRKLIMPVIEGKADMTIARFPKAKKKGGFGLVKGLARNGIKLLTGLEMAAPLSGQRAMTREVIRAIGRFSSGYGVEVGLTIDIARKGYKILEVDVNMTHAETGRDLRGFMHRGKQFMHVSKVLARRLIMR